MVNKKFQCFPSGMSEGISSPTTLLMFPGGLLSPPKSEAPQQESTHSSTRKYPQALTNE